MCTIVFDKIIAGISSLFNDDAPKEGSPLVNARNVIESSESSIAAYKRTDTSLTPGIATKGTASTTTGTSSTASVQRARRQKPQTKPLEELLSDKICIKIDVKAKCGFRDYLVPNESSPIKVKK